MHLRFRLVMHAQSVSSVYTKFYPAYIHIALSGNCTILAFSVMKYVVAAFAAAMSHSEDYDLSI